MRQEYGTYYSSARWDVLQRSSRAGGHRQVGNIPGFGPILFHSTRRHRSSILPCGARTHERKWRRPVDKLWEIEFPLGSPFPRAWSCADIRSSAKASSENGRLRVDDGRWLAVVPDSPYVPQITIYLFVSVPPHQPDG